jgi:hypothetical protein
VIPVARTFKNLYVSIAAPSTPNEGFNFYLVKVASGSPSNTALTCGLMTSSASTVSCSNTSNTVSAPAGDQFAFGGLAANSGTTSPGRILASVQCQ